MKIARLSMKIVSVFADGKWQTQMVSRNGNAFVGTADVTSAVSGEL